MIRVALISLLTVATVPVAAQEPVIGALDDPFAGLEALPDQDLQEKRGGFVVGGYDIDVGALVTTRDELVAALFTDADVLRRALESAGEDATIYPFESSPLVSGGIVNVIQNDQDNETIRQSIRIDVVIVNEIATIRRDVEFSSLESSLPRPEVFSSF